jgi:predicted transcriptional regulator of viral defense system
MSSERPDERNLCFPCAAAIAGRQWGNVTTAQLKQCGLGRNAISGWARAGKLHPIHRGVYAVGHVSPAPEARWAAALLACGEGAALSHRTAMALHGLDRPPEIVQVSLARKVRAHEAVRVHFPSVPFQRGELIRAKGLLATSVPRTLLDMAAVGESVDRLVADAVAQRLVSLTALRAYLERRTGARGSARLRRGIEGKQTRSGLERRFLRWLAEHGFPPPETNVKIGALTVDAYWAAAGLVVEIDTIGTHGTAYSFERDRRRDAYLAARGLRVIRVTEERLLHDGARLADDLRRALAA